MLINGRKIFIKSLVGFLILLSLVYILIGSNFHDIFVKNYLFETEKIIYLGKEYTSGILNWQVLRNHIIIAVLSIFIITFIINYLAFQKGSKMFLDSVTQRIVELKKGVRVRDQIDFIAIDREVKELIDKKDDLTKKIKAQFIEYNQEMMFLAHDLKTPLAVIIGYTNLLIDNPDIDDNSKNKSLKIVLDSSHQLESLIDKFFELSKYSVKSDLSKKKRIKLEDILFEIQESLYVYRKDYDVTFDNDLNENIYIDVNPELFARALINIYKNAIRYSSKGTQIHTKVAMNDKDRIFISISNKLESIEEVNTNEMFNTFYTGANSLDGNGLGLPIAKAVIEKQGGEIYSEKEADIMNIVIKL